MATGTGKTLTSLFCANELSKKIELTSVLIIVPLKDLVDQWQKDIEECFSGEIIPIRSGLDWKGKLSDLRLLKILKKDEKNKKLVIITTYDSFCGNDDKILESLDLDSTLIIADEVHKFGAASYSKKLPEQGASKKRPNGSFSFLFTLQRSGIDLPLGQSPQKQGAFSERTVFLRTFREGICRSYRQSRSL